MFIRYLSLTNFRNYRRFESPLPTGPLILVGRNAQGKTSVLEAIYYLATATSPHGTDRQLINWLSMRNNPQVFMKIVAEVQTAQEIRKLDIRLELLPTGPGREPRLRKTILINGLKKKVADLSGVVNVVLFLPQDMRLIEGAPSDRRRYLDITICQVDREYYTALAEYQKVLSQRNATLKSFQEKRRVDEAMLAFWDDSLCTLGAKIIARRARALEELELYASPAHHKLTDGAEHLRLSYRPAYDPIAEQPTQLGFGMDVPTQRARLSEKEIAAGMAARLKQTRHEEMQRGLTLIGPHRDEYRFVASGVDLGIYGSRGQGRTAILAMKLAEMRWMQDRTGEAPILLLDEVLAELDPIRRRDLLNHVTGVEQSLMTTTDLRLFEDDFRTASQAWEVSEGVVTPID